MLCKERAVHVCSVYPRGCPQVERVADSNTCEFGNEAQVHPCWPAGHPERAVSVAAPEPRLCVRVQAASSVAALIASKLLRLEELCDIIDRHTMTSPSMLDKHPMRTDLTVAILDRYIQLVKTGT